MDLPEQIAAVRKPAASGNLKQELIASYAEVCAAFGYQQVKSFVDLLVERPGERVAFEIQFGNKDEFYASIKDMFATGASLCVLVTSSRAHAINFKDLKEYVTATFNMGSKHILFVDIETNRFVKVNFEAEEVEVAFLESARRRESPESSEGGKSAPIFRDTEPVVRQRHKKIHGRKGEHKEQD